MKVGDLVGLTELYKQKYRNFPATEPGAGLVVNVCKKASRPSETLHIKVLWPSWNGDVKLKIMRPNWVEGIS